GCESGVLGGSFIFLLLGFKGCLPSVGDQYDRQVSIDVGGVMGEVIAIDWRDREGYWIEFIR
ncbi:hypothetical protein Golax_023177, partial [Gossypium laxum]|nr:hypothetical protein [Gossypium laxum]